MPRHLFKFKQKVSFQSVSDIISDKKQQFTFQSLDCLSGELNPEVVQSTAFRGQNQVRWLPFDQMISQNQNQMISQNQNQTISQTELKPKPINSLRRSSSTLQVMFSH